MQRAVRLRHVHPPAIRPAPSNLDAALSRVKGLEGVVQVGFDFYFGGAHERFIAKIADLGSSVPSEGSALIFTECEVPEADFTGRQLTTDSVGKRYQHDLHLQ